MGREIEKSFSPALCRYLYLKFPLTLRRRKARLDVRSAVRNLYLFSSDLTSTYADVRPALSQGWSSPSLSSLALSLSLSLSLFLSLLELLTAWDDDCLGVFYTLDSGNTNLQTFQTYCATCVAARHRSLKHLRRVAGLRPTWATLFAKLLWRQPNGAACLPQPSSSLWRSRAS